MDVCVNHRDTLAVEHCELCGDALCPRCLWYADDGRRLCERHAREQAAVGAVVVPPETYQEAIDHMERRGAGPLQPDQDGLYRGNQSDLGALAAATLGVVTLASCFGGAYCFPLIAVILGIIMYINADKATDPKRTRLLAGIGIGTGGVFVLAIFGFIFFYVAIVLFAILAGGP